MKNIINRINMELDWIFSSEEKNNEIIDFI